MLIFQLFLWGVVNYYSPIIFQPEPPKCKIEVFLQSEYMNIITHRESRNDSTALNYNTNGTIDGGKYQINSSNFSRWGVNINDYIVGDKFIMPMWLQDYYRYHFIMDNVEWMNYKGIQVTNERIYQSWAGIAYVK